jgi:hypothetical protein
VDAWAGSMWIGAAIAVIAAGLVVVLSLGRKGREEMQASAQPVLDDESASPTPVPDADAPLPHPEPVLVGIGAGNGNGSGSGDRTSTGAGRPGGP